MQKLPRFAEIKKLQQSLYGHKLYAAVNTEEKLKIFMEDHIFAVWDFMILLKQLQRKLTCMDKIWLPPQSSNTARFINEIVMSQECDVHPDGQNHASHFQLYLAAMKEAGANTTTIQRFIKNLSQGKDIHEELKNPNISEHARTFVSNTLAAIEKPTSYVAAQFYFGRQDPIPQMFQKFVKTMDENKSKKFNMLKYYLKRHIEVDGGSHGPLSLRLLTELGIREDPTYDQMMDGGINAITNRIKLWDGIHAKIS